MVRTDGFKTMTRSMDASGRPFVMHGPDGMDWQNVITYEEVTPPKRLVYLHGDDKEPDMFHNTITFDDEGGKTALTMRACSRRPLPGVRRARARRDRGGSRRSRGWTRTCGG
jgi:uncharacterized protein YndB with AHSA1/START domain